MASSESESKWTPETAAHRLRSRRRLRITSVCVLCLILLSALVDHLRANAPFRDDWATFDNHQFRVLRLTNADSIIIRADNSDDLTSLHLLGTRPFKYPVYKSLATATDTEFTGQLITLHLNPTQTRDDKNRLVADAVLEDGKPLSVELVAAGLTLADHHAPSAFLAALDRAETQARKRGLGMWRER